MSETRGHRISTRGEKGRTVLVEHPVRRDFKLTGEAQPDPGL